VKVNTALAAMLLLKLVSNALAASRQAVGYQDGSV